MVVKLLPLLLATDFQYSAQGTGSPVLSPVIMLCLVLYVSHFYVSMLLLSEFPLMDSTAPTRMVQASG